MSSSRLRICAWTDTSRAETGSSQMTTLGSSTSDRAIEMRWHWPPENWWGRLSEATSGSSPTASSTSRDPRLALVLGAALPDAQRLGDDVLDLAARVQRRDRVLEDDLQAGADLAERSGSSTAARSTPSNSTRPLVGRGSCMIARPVVDLPQPDSPTRPRVSPSRTSRLMPETAWTDAGRRVELDDEVLDPQQDVVGVAEVGGAGTGHQSPPPGARRHLGGHGDLLGQRGVAGDGRLGGGHVVSQVASPVPRGRHRCRRGTSSGTRARASPLPAAAAPRRGTWAARTGSAVRTGSPDGGLMRSGGRPPMICSRVWLGCSSFGIDFSRASVYGIRTLANSAVVGAFSTI